MAEAKAEATKSPAPKKNARKVTPAEKGPDGSEAREKGFYGKESAIPNDRYELTSSEKPHPNEEVAAAKVRNGERDPKNTGEA
jgi:hypothetical protein